MFRATFSSPNAPKTQKQVMASDKEFRMLCILLRLVEA